MRHLDSPFIACRCFCKQSLSRPQIRPHSRLSSLSPPGAPRPGVSSAFKNKKYGKAQAQPFKNPQNVLTITGNKKCFTIFISCAIMVG